MTILILSFIITLFFTIVFYPVHPNEPNSPAYAMIGITCVCIFCMLLNEFKIDFTIPFVLFSCALFLIPVIHNIVKKERLR